MKVLQIGDNVKCGHRFNGHDLGKYLRSQGISSEHSVSLKNKEDQYTHEIAESFPRREEWHEVSNNLNYLFSSNALVIWVERTRPLSTSMEACSFIPNRGLLFFTVQPDSRSL